MLGVIGNKFSIGKETYHPFVAELHYFRIEKKYWSICFERIKRAGFRIIASAVPWGIHQEDSKGIDFSGYSDPRKDLVVFLELAREFGFKVILRPGPWVAGQLKNGGLPDFLFNDIKVFARDAAGEEIKLPDEYGVNGGYLASYLHPNFQFYLKKYFASFIEITKNYIHPRGPVFMIELDYETSFGRQLEPHKADYNKDVLAKYYAPFLEKKYEDVKKLNSAYKEKNQGFDVVEPPRSFDKLTLEGLPKIMDWFRFREFMLNHYLEIIEDIFKAYTVEPLFFRSLYFRPGELIPAYNLIPEDRSPFLGSNVFPEGKYFDLSNKARFLRAEYGFGFATSFTSGLAASDPVREKKLAPVNNNIRRFYFAGGLSSGYKGLNYYMFVDRDHWYGSPLHNDGTVSKGYEVIKKFNQTITSVGFEEMENQPDVAVLGNRLYYWMRFLAFKKGFEYVERLMGETLAGVCRDLLRLKIIYGVRENKDFDTLSKYKMLVVPSTEIMAEKDQEALVELSKAGVALVLIGVMPRYNEEFKDCQILAKHYRIKTTPDYRIGSITHKDGSFPAYIYGSIRSSDDAKVKKLVQSGSKIVGVCSSRFKGNFYLFSFDLASSGNHNKISFIESVLEKENISNFLYCSDPSVDITFQMGEKKGLLFVVVPPPGELSDGIEASQKEIIIRADLKKGGFSSARVKLTNILAEGEDQVIKTTSAELREGMSLQVNYPDGIVFLVEKR